MQCLQNPLNANNSPVFMGQMSIDINLIVCLVWLIKVLQTYHLEKDTDYSSKVLKNR